MRLINKKGFYSKVAIVLLTSFSFEIIYPSVAFALTSGPVQPEFSSFEPVGTTNMVDDFTGDFTYNLPVLEVPGPHGSSYSMSLSYHSGTTPEEESSWVGYGWTLNPGAITRNTRGFPDDYKSSDVTYHNKMPMNWTASAGAGALFEGFSIDATFAPQASASIRYNNYKGFGYNAGLGVIMGKGVVSLGYNVSDGEGSFSLNVNPAQILSQYKEYKDNKNSKEEGPKGSISKEQWKANKKAAKEGNQKLQVSNLSLLGSQYGVFSYSDVTRPDHIPKYTGGSVNVSLGFLATPSFLPLGISGNVFGSFSYQENEESTNVNAFGYMYSAEASEGDAMDYITEKETNFQKRDIFLGIPFNTADNFIVSGEGIGGGFRMHNKSAGQFRPRREKSVIRIGSVGAEIEGGINFGAGLDVGYGEQSLETMAWRPEVSKFTKFDETTDEPVFFRFNNDTGGSWEPLKGDAPVSAKLSGSVDLPDLEPKIIHNGGPGLKKFDPDISHIEWENTLDERNLRSSYIGYHTNAEIVAAQTSKYKVYTHRTDINNLVNRSHADLRDGIGEIAVFNKQGAKHLYSLPVYSRNEKNIQYGVQGVSGSNVDNNYLVYAHNTKTKIGEERNAPYASAFLLTDITTPDYIDRTLDGPSKDDFGGYTKFSYKRIYGGNEADWFNWRIPYRGLMYHKNSLSDPLDDLGSVSEGEKEIYYLKSVETKSHRAVFVLDDKDDGIEAPAQAMNRNAVGTKKLKRLLKIDLYKISDENFEANGNVKPDAKPIKTVHFQYAEDIGETNLLRNTPNAVSGRLTLKRVWFEYHGIVKSKISPYIFDYKYPQYGAEVDYPAKYSDLISPYSLVNQNPDYSNFDLDAWGNYQLNGIDRYDDMKTWVNQRKMEPGVFDPAVWQLKKITLPTGGQIHVQYEQDDYGYVQDKVAHIFTNISGYDPTEKKYYINTDEIGVVDNHEKEILVKLLHDRYKIEGERIYFKFLYKLMGTEFPQLNHCDVEYIDGYAKVTDIGLGDGKVFIRLESDEKQLPYQVCKDFVMTQRAGKINSANDCDPSSAGIDPARSPEQIVNSLIKMAQSIAVPTSLCANVNFDLSYFRVPAPVSKKGGGLRVKRLLMYDDGLSGAPVLYGNEYDYNFFDEAVGAIRSSGVATNEPSSIRDENILVDFIGRKKQSWVNKVIAGRDKKQSEGPLGESIYPSAMVGYSRITIKNIHSRKTNPGFTVKEFYTAREYPVKVQKTDIHTKKDYLPIPAGLVNLFTNNLWATQGFSFVLNNMHGQVKRHAEYTGDYSDVHKLAKAVIVSEQQYEYFQPGESIPVMDGLTGGILTDYVNPGKEVDITMAQKAVKDLMFDRNVELDFDVGILFPIPVPFITGMPTITNTEMEMYTHATSKVVRYPAIMKKSTVYQDGIYHSSENLAFDKYSGDPVVVKSYDEFSGVYLSQSIPASWNYPNMGQMAMNEGLVTTGFTYELEGTTEYLTAEGDANCSALTAFVKGDLLDLGNDALYYVSDFDYLNNRAVITPSKISAGSPTAVNSVKVVKSGRNNQLAQQAGQITYHSEADNIAVPVISKEDLYTSNAFTDALNNQISNLSGTSGSFTLAGPYNNMNMSEYAACAPEGCGLDFSDMSISSVVFRYDPDGDNVSLKLMSFQVSCSNGNVIINSDQCNL